jgi:thiol-disulfide isomerase/thioredoxin
MKKLYLFILSVLYGGSLLFSQSQFEVLPDRDGSKMLKGIISRDILEKDTAFNKWFFENQKGFTPQEAAVTGLKQYADSVQLLVFMGTWCEDSHFVIPRFFSLLDKAGFSKDRVTLIGVDRDKKTSSHLAEALGITNVPTIIVLKKGKEMGRVIEYGHDGLFDKELGTILSGKK